MKEALDEAIANLEPTFSLEDELTAAEAKIPAIKKRIEQVKIGKLQKLRSLIPYLEQQLNKDREAVRADLDAQLERVHYARAILLQEVAALYEIDRKATRLHAEFNALKQDAGEEVKHYDNGSFLDNIPADPNPAYFGEEEAGKKALTVTHWLIVNASNGNLPAWALDLLAKYSKGGKR